MRSILHITYDYAEENIGKSTVVISELIDETSKYFENRIISLKRIINPLKEKIELKENLINFYNFGLPKGILLKYNHLRCSKKIMKFLVEKGELEFNFIHSHKLTFEGFIGFELAKNNNKSLLISLRQTDFMVLKYRKDLIPYCKKILDYSSIIFYIAPYMLKRMENIFGSHFVNSISDKMFLLPNPINFNKFLFNYGQRANYYLAILWLEKRSVKRKNLLNLLKAIKILSNEKIKLKIIGKGGYENIVKKWIERLGLVEQVELVGFIENDRIYSYIQESKGLLLPSFSETFGVVYAESLLCGTPILYSVNTGFDGFFEKIGVAVNPHSVSDIAKGIQIIDEYNDLLRKNIIELYKNGAFEIFKKENIAKKYNEILTNVLC